MDLHLEYDIRAQILRYLSGELELEQFDDWFAGTLWMTYRENDPEALDLALDIEQMLGLFSLEYWTEMELRAHLLQRLLLTRARWGVAWDVEPVDRSTTMTRRVLVDEPDEDILETESCSSASTQRKSLTLHLVAA